MSFKKMALVVAAAIAAPSAFAVSDTEKNFSLTDSNVTLYGLVTAGVDYTTNGKEWATKFQDYGTRVGFKGADRFNANNSVIWQIESRVRLAGKDSGVGQWGTREAWVGLENGTLGTLRIGRGKNQFELLVNEFDTFDGNSTMANALNNNAWSQRFDSAVFYDSPSWGGFTVGASFATDGEKTQVKAANAEKYAGVVKFAHPNFVVSAAFEQENNVDIGKSSIATTGPGALISGAGRVRNYAAGVQFIPVEGFKLGVLYKNTTNWSAGGEQNGQKKLYSRDSGMAILEYQIGNFTPSLGWVHQAKAKSKSKDYSDIKAANMYVAGFKYKMSNRTRLFAEYSYIDNAKENGFSTTSDAAVDNIEKSTWKNPQSFAVGIVANF